MGLFNLNAKENFLPKVSKTTAELVAKANSKSTSTTIDGSEKSTTIEPPTTEQSPNPSPSSFSSTSTVTGTHPANTVPAHLRLPDTPPTAAAFTDIRQRPTTPARGGLVLFFDELSLRRKIYKQAKANKVEASKAGK